MSFLIQTLGTWYVQPKEEKAKGKPYSCLQRPVMRGVEKMEPASSYRCAMAQEAIDTSFNKVNCNYV